MLDSDEVGADQRDVIDLPERTNNTSVINARNKNSQQVS